MAFFCGVGIATSTLLLWTVAAGVAATDDLRLVEAVRSLPDVLYQQE